MQFEDHIVEKKKSSWYKKFDNKFVVHQGDDHLTSDSFFFVV